MPEPISFSLELVPPPIDWQLFHDSHAVRLQEAEQAGLEALPVIIAIGPPGPPGPAGSAPDFGDVPDLTLIFDNGLV